MEETIVETKDKKTEKRTVSPDYDVPCLSTFEFLLYLSIWSYYLALGCYEIYKLAYNKKTVKHFLNNQIIELSYFGLYKTSAEYLWNECVELFIRGWQTVFLYIIISKILRYWTTPNIFMSVCVILSILLNYKYSSLKFLGMEMLMFFLFVIAGLTRSRIVTWLLCLAMFSCFRTISDFEFFNTQYLFLHSFSYIALLITRGTSVGIIIAESPKYNLKLLLELLFYYWYYPAIIGCRMMSSRDFIEQIYKPYSIKDLKIWFYHCLSILFYLILWSLVINLIPVNLILSTHETKHMSMGALSGITMFLGINYYMTYIVLYKTVYLVTQMDGFLTTEGPECIGHIALYSRMWRNFDRGMHVWLKEILFRPIVKLGDFRITKHFAVISCFGFVFMFHGFRIQNFVYVSVNAFQFYAEHFFKYIYLSTWFGSFMEKHLSPIFIRRIFGLLGAFSFLLSTISFSAYQIGVPLMTKMFSSCLKNDNNFMYFRVFILLLFMYVHSQISLTVCEYTRKRKSKTN